MIIYKSSNIINGKIYIGYTKNTLSKRIKQHIRDSSISDYAFHRAIRKYGEDNFKWEIIETCLTLNELKEREIYWISKLKSNKKGIGYNMAPGGIGGDIISFLPNRDEIRKKIAKSNTGQTRTKKTRDKMSNSRMGIIFTKEHCDNISKSRLGELNPMFGKKQSDDTLKARSKSMIGKNVGKTRSNKFKENRSKEYKGKSNPNYKKIENIQSIINDYNNGLSLMNISIKYKLDVRKIKREFKLNNINIRRYTKRK